MKKLNNYAEAKTFTAKEVLPVGGYVCKILDAKVQENTWGDKLIVSFDIEEGEQKGFYAKNYKSQTEEDKKWKGNYRISVPTDDGSEEDNKKMSAFKSFIKRIEDSNNGYHWDWDELKLKGKLIGIVFNDKEWEYNGRTGFFTNPLFTETIENIREGKFKVPEPTYLKKKTGSAQVGSDGFMAIPDSSDEELPFN